MTDSWASALDGSDEARRSAEVERAAEVVLEGQQLLLDLDRRLNATREATRALRAEQDAIDAYRIKKLQLAQRPAAVNGLLFSSSPNKPAAAANSAQQPPRTPGDIVFDSSRQYDAATAAGSSSASSPVPVIARPPGDRARLAPRVPLPLDAPTAAGIAPDFASDAEGAAAALTDHLRNTAVAPVWVLCAGGVFVRAPRRAALRHLEETRAETTEMIEAARQELKAAVAEVARIEGPDSALARLHTGFDLKGSATGIGNMLQPPSVV
jgi:hypothetical protein